jgi:thioredoxin-related protein
MAVLISMPCQVIGAVIDWKQFNEGIRLAEKQDKKIFLHFRTDWCGYCSQMERVSFKDSAVVKFLNENFVSIKVDGDKEKSITELYKVTGYPDNRFLDGKKKEAFRLPGFVDPMTLLFFLEYIQSDSFKTMDPMQYYKNR